MDGAWRGVRGQIGRAEVDKLRTWKLEDAKAKFSEVVRRGAATRHPPRDAVNAVDAFKSLLPAKAPRQSLVEFLRSTALCELDVRREPDRGRDLAL